RHPAGIAAANADAAGRRSDDKLGLGGAPRGTRSARAWRSSNPGAARPATTCPHHPPRSGGGSLTGSPSAAHPIPSPRRGEGQGEEAPTLAIMLPEARDRRAPIPSALAPEPTR